MEAVEQLFHMVLFVSITLQNDISLGCFFQFVDSAVDREGTNISSKYGDMYTIALVCFDTGSCVHSNKHKMNLFWASQLRSHLFHKSYLSRTRQSVGDFKAASKYNWWIANCFYAFKLIIQNNVEKNYERKLNSNSLTRKQSSSGLPKTNSAAPLNRIILNWIEIIWLTYKTHSLAKRHPANSVLNISYSTLFAVVTRSKDL